MTDHSDEAPMLRDIARRAADLVRRHGRADVPYVELTSDERRAIDRDAATLHDALHRAGYYPEAWGS